MSALAYSRNSGNTTGIAYTRTVLKHTLRTHHRMRAIFSVATNHYRNISCCLRRQSEQEAEQIR